MRKVQPVNFHNEEYWMLPFWSVLVTGFGVELLVAVLLTMVAGYLPKASHSTGTDVI